jgi:glycosyltransferase involved in cell wall biosynthesis
VGEVKANSTRRVLTAQVMDAANNNAQVLNAKALLPRFQDPDTIWITLTYNEPDARVRASPSVQLVRLWRRHLWYLHKVVFYQFRADCIFYPGPYWFDEWGLRIRGFTGREVPVVSTIEGLVGNSERERVLSGWAGHRVYCQRVTDAQLKRIDWIYNKSTRIVAISPFLGEIARRLYGEKVVVEPLGIDTPASRSPSQLESSRFQVIGAGTVYDRKRPEVFLELAGRFPDADFTWYGEGKLRSALVREAESRGLTNMCFPGGLGHEDLLGQMTRAQLFVLPAWAEGAPKVTQEAAAAGLPVIVFGFYESPSVANGVNGFVVWDDVQLLDRVGQLIGDPDEAMRMGARGAEMAASWSWDRAASAWEAAILGAIDSSRRRGRH